MAIIDIVVPDIGDFDEVGVIELLVKPGDSVKFDQGLIVVESDKASMEIPSSHAGVVQSISVKLGDKVKQGSVVVQLEVANAGASAVAPSPAAPAPAPVATAVAAPAPVGCAGGQGAGGPAHLWRGRPDPQDPGRAPHAPAGQPATPAQHGRLRPGGQRLFDRRWPEPAGAARLKHSHRSLRSLTCSFHLAL